MLNKLLEVLSNNEMFAFVVVLSEIQILLWGLAGKYGVGIETRIAKLETENTQNENYMLQAQQEYAKPIEPEGDVLEEPEEKYKMEDDFEMRDLMENSKDGTALSSAMEKQRLFVDMDGTLAVFTPVDKLETLYQEGYFANLKPIDNVVEAVKLMIHDHPEIEVNILSAYLSDSPYALAEKNAWLDKNLPELDSAYRIFLPCGQEKKDYIPDGLRTTDYLLDDYTKNLNEWEPPAKGIKLLNGINHTRGTWEKACIRYDKKPLALAAGIVAAMRGEAAAQEATSDPHSKEKIALEQRIEQLELLRQEHSQAQHRAQEKLEKCPSQLADLRSTIDAMTKNCIALVRSGALPLQIEETENELIAVKEEARQAKKEMEQARLLLEKPFEQAGELEEATARRMELDTENEQTEGFDHNAGLEPNAAELVQAPPAACEPVMF